MKFIFWVIQLPISYIQNCNLAKSGMHSISQIIQVYPRYIPNISITSSTGHIRFKPLGSKFTRNIARKFIDCYISFFCQVYMPIANYVPPGPSVFSIIFFQVRMYPTYSLYPEFWFYIPGIFQTCSIISSL